MKKNMGTSDRTIRIILAIVFGILYFSGTVTGGWGITLLVLAAIFILTSIIGFCPAYALAGINTCSTKRTA